MPKTANNDAHTLGYYLNVTRVRDLIAKYPTLLNKKNKKRFVSFVKKELKVSDAMAYNYIRDAYKEFIEIATADVQKTIATALNKLDNIERKAIEKINDPLNGPKYLEVARRTLRDKNELLGLYKNDLNINARLEVVNISLPKEDDLTEEEKKEIDDADIERS